MSASSDFVIENSVLKKYYGLESVVVIPEGISSIDDFAFWFCSHITSITLPKSLTSIGKGAFYGCSGLTNIVIPEGVSSIRETAFKGCSSLTSIVIPEGVSFIGNYAFYGCSSLTSIVIPEGVSSIGESVFEDCSGLTNIILFNSLPSIGKAVFRGCSSLTNIVFPKGVSYIEEYAFSDCTSLTSIVIPEGVSSIKCEAFSSCSGLTNITLPNTLKCIGDKAFSNCSALTSIVIPKGVSFIGRETFKGCSHLTSIVISEGVSSIWDFAFHDCSFLTSITLPNSLTSIGKYAFSGCSSLLSITLPTSLSSIGDAAFSGCSGFTTITLPESLTSIGDAAFSGCFGLTNIVIPESVTSIARSAFERCNGLTSITLPESLTSIGDAAFSGCSGLTNIVIPEGVTSIARSTFERCNGLTSITLPESLTSIGDAAFSGCSGLANIVIPGGVTSIARSAFERCNGLTSITLPESLTSIGDAAFSRCSGLTNIVIPEGVTSIGRGVFECCNGLTSITIPESLTFIGDVAFSGCSGLTSFIFSNSSLKLAKSVFGDSLPAGLLQDVPFLFHLSDDALSLFLTSGGWSALPPDICASIYLSRQSKSLFPAYLVAVNRENAYLIGDCIAKRITLSSSAKECSTAANYLLQFQFMLNDDIINKIYDAISGAKKSKKALTAIAEDSTLYPRIRQNNSGQKYGLSEIEQRYIALAEKICVSAFILESKLNETFALKLSNLPDMLLTKDGAVASKETLALILLAENDNKRPGRLPETISLVEELDEVSLQSALLNLADCYLGSERNSKKLNLSMPICHLANEETMRVLTSRAPKWSSGHSGFYAPPLWTFRTANQFSNTRSAILFAERYHDLGGYARLRGMDEDSYRDSVVIDLGLDANGTKDFDLGCKTIKLFLDEDLTLSVVDGDGNVSKSIPVQNSDPEKYASAEATFKDIKTKAEKFAKKKLKRLKEDFLSGMTRDVNSWTSSYTGNPLLKRVARLVVWNQGKSTFILTETGYIDADGKTYILSSLPIGVAHPMEMDTETRRKWQDYFLKEGLKQPFVQMWESVADLDKISSDRYKGCKLPYGKLLRADCTKVHDEDNHNLISISFYGCDATVERLVFHQHSISRSDPFEVTEIKVNNKSRLANHSIAWLDKTTVLELIAKDDITIEQFLPTFTAAQISEFITTAQKKKAVNCATLLLDYKNKIFPDANSFTEFILDLV